MTQEVISDVDSHRLVRLNVPTMGTSSRVFVALAITAALVNNCLQSDRDEASSGTVVECDHDGVLVGHRWFNK